VSQDQITVQNLDMVFTTSKGAGRVRALEGLNLNIPSGQFYSVLGPSGCGKSTLLRIVGGLLEPTSGSVKIGNDTGPQAAQHAKEIGFVFQSPGLLPWKTVKGNVELPFQLNRKVNRTPQHTSDELIELVGLQRFADAYPHQLSGGMQQRVAIARALASDPKLLLMDEPFGALDAITRRAMRYELLRIWEGEQKTVIFVTHSIPEAIVLSDAVAVLSARPGRLAGMIKIDLSRPRTEAMEQTPEFLDYVNELTGLLKE
jgi:NitT/TauT family transport system ATP-binding protein